VPGIEACGVTSPDEFAELLCAVAERRDREAFKRLFDHFAPRIHGYLLRLGLDPTVAEELTQEVMATMWRKAALFDRSKSSVATWLYRVARNRRIDTFRREREFGGAQGDPLLVPDLAPAPDDSLDASRREDLVRSALGRLPDEQLALVRFAFFEGLSHSEIADRTGLPLGTVKSRIRLAFTRLRRALNDAGVNDAGSMT
jgi:RNA polymerase sigma factor (sigma-70 family)